MNDSTALHPDEANQRMREGANAAQQEAQRIAQRLRDHAGPRRPPHAEPYLFYSDWDLAIY
jgi:hypothetical protein